MTGRGRVELQLRNAQPRDLVWAAMRKAQVFSINELGKRTYVDTRTVRSFVERLAAGGVIQAIEPKADLVGEQTYRLVKDTGAEPPRLRLDGTELPAWNGRDRVWAAMKPLKAFTARELAALAERPLEDVKSYLKALTQAGFVIITRLTPRPSQYRLLATMNTGPKPPQILKDGHVFDPNTGKRHATRKVKP